jgi:lipoyl synthase
MELKIYKPLPRFPPISLSGGRCQLNCRHCNRTYLGGMTQADTPERLLRVCRRLEAEGALGVLLSGGSDREGRLMNLRRMLPAIRRVREETNLILNVHPGLLDRETAGDLHVDFASLEIPGDETLERVFGLDATTEDYLTTYQHLVAAGVHVVPHVTVYHGREAALLETIEAPETIVVIVFSPTRGTPMAEVPPPDADMVGQVVADLRTMHPGAEIALGCMRPRRRPLREEIERAALDAGVSRMVLPARSTVETAQERGYTLTHFDACCALPQSLVQQSPALAKCASAGDC